jgi:hypothetical protein
MTIRIISPNRCTILRTRIFQILFHHQLPDLTLCLFQLLTTWSLPENLVLEYGVLFLTSLALSCCLLHVDAYSYLYLQSYNSNSSTSNLREWLVIRPVPCVTNTRTVSPPDTTSLPSGEKARHYIINSYVYRRPNSIKKKWIHQSKEVKLKDKGKPPFSEIDK